MVKYSIRNEKIGRLTAAALGGLFVGTALSGCGGSAPAPASAPAATSSVESGAAQPVAGEMHACKGLNGCKGQGAGGANACAGQGGCASAAMQHECKGHNACKGQGGCGEAPGTNMCKGHGSCAVPMKDEAAWKKAREAFEQKMKAEGKEAGPAPA